MDTASGINPVQLQEQAKKRAETFSHTASGVVADPKKTTYFMVGSVVVVSVVLIGYLLISQFFLSSEKLDTTSPSQKVSVEDFDKERKDDIQNINTALQNYKIKNSVYPASLVNLVPDYLKEIPRDPQTNASYIYVVSLDFKGYRIEAVLSDGKSYSLGGN